MGRQRREFTPEYKDEAVKLVINTGRPVAVVARELGIQESTLGRWVNLFKSRQDAGDGAVERDRAGRAGPAAQGELGAEDGSGVLEKSLPLLRPGSIGYEREAFALMHAEKSNHTVIADGAAARGLPLRVLRLVEAAALEAGDPGRADRGQDRLVPRRVRRGLRGTEDPGRSTRGRRGHLPQDGREDDAQARSTRDLPTSVAHHHDRDDADTYPPDAVQAGLGHRGPQRRLGRRHHRTSDHLDSSSRRNT